MKGVFIHQQLEYRVEVTGDSFEQGDAVPSVFSVKNHGASPQPLTGLFMQLASGACKKVKEKAEDAFKTIAFADISVPAQIDGQQSLAFPWTFTLDRNAPISEKAQSLFLVYGSVLASGNSPLTVVPHSHIELVLHTLETTFQFVRKAGKSTAGWVSTKFKPPTSSRYAMVNELNLKAQFEGEVLVLKFIFNVKRFVTGQAGVDISKGETEIEKRLEPSQYVLPGDVINHEVLDRTIEEALGVVASGL